MRYSPRPQGAYLETPGLLDTTERWNLAWLSHDYAQGHHRNPEFTTLVRRTSQSKLDGSGVALIPGDDATVASLLRLPAPRFVYLIKGHAALPSLPLFQTLGASWLEGMDSRSKGCWYDDQGLVPEPVEGTAEAQELINLTRRKT